MFGGNKNKAKETNKKISIGIPIFENFLGRKDDELDDYDTKEDDKDKGDFFFEDDGPTMEQELARLKKEQISNYDMLKRKLNEDYNDDFFQDKDDKEEGKSSGIQEKSYSNNDFQPFDDDFQELDSDFFSNDDEEGYNSSLDFQEDEQDYDADFSDDNNFSEDNLLEGDHASSKFNKEKNHFLSQIQKLGSVDNKRKPLKKPSPSKDEPEKLLFNTDKDLKIPEIDDDDDEINFGKMVLGEQEKSLDPAGIIGDVYENVQSLNSQDNMGNFQPSSFVLFEPENEAEVDLLHNVSKEENVLKIDEVSEIVSFRTEEQKESLFSEVNKLSDDQIKDSGIKEMHELNLEQDIESFLFDSSKKEYLDSDEDYTQELETEDSDAIEKLLKGLEIENEAIEEFEEVIDVDRVFVQPDKDPMKGLAYKLDGDKASNVTSEFYNCEKGKTKINTTIDIKSINDSLINKYNVLINKNKNSEFVKQQQKLVNRHGVLINKNNRYDKEFLNKVIGRTRFASEHVNKNIEKNVFESSHEIYDSNFIINKKEESENRYRVSVDEYIEIVNDDDYFDDSNDEEMKFLEFYCRNKGYKFYKKGNDLLNFISLNDGYFRRFKSQNENIFLLNKAISNVIYRDALKFMDENLEMALKLFEELCKYSTDIKLSNRALNMIINKLVKLNLETKRVNELIDKMFEKEQKLLFLIYDY